MGKLLVLLIAVAAAIWWLGSRRGPRPPPAGTGEPAAPPAPRPQAQPQPQPMLACAHCGVHLPQADALVDAAGRPFCSEAHCLAGPRPPA